MDDSLKVQIERKLPDAFRHQTAARAARMTLVVCEAMAIDMLKEKSDKPSKREIQIVVELQDRLDQILELLELYESC